jgi:hypothetical protein
VPLAVQNGETVMCMAFSEPTAPTGGASSREPASTGGVFVRTYSVPSGGSDSSNDGSTMPEPEPAPTGAASSSSPEEYECTSGGASCPPPDAPVPSSDGASKPGAGAGSYACTEQGRVIDCTKKELVCKAGTMPAPSGDRCIADGTAAPAAPAPAPAPAGEAPAAEAAPAGGRGSPRYEIVSPDPNSQLYGVKWETGGGFSDGLFTITTTGATRGAIKFATKGPKVAYGVVDGPICR